MTEKCDLENFMAKINQDKNLMEQFKIGLLTRPYAIHQLGHDVPENRPAQPQTPNFMMPQPSAGGQPPQDGGTSPMGDEPDMLDPNQVSIAPKKAAAPQNVPTNQAPVQGEQPAPVNNEQKQPQPQQAVASRSVKVGLKSINVDELEGTRMSNDGYAQTVYIRKSNAKGEIEETPYTPVEVLFLKDKAKGSASMVNTKKTLKDGAAMEGQNIVPVEPVDPEIEQEEGEVEEQPPMPTSQEAAPQAAAPQGQQAPAQQPNIPGYFQPYSEPKGYRPKFADIFGDTEYSIKNPQRHVEKVREEMIDAYGQKHKRVHERTREQHKPGGAPEETDFIKRKKASASKRWMKKSPTQIKQSKNQEVEYLASVDVCLQQESNAWVTNLEHAVVSTIDATHARLVAGTKDIEKNTPVERQSEMLNSLVASELLMGNERLQANAKKGMQNLYSAGLNFAKDVFAFHYEESTDSVDIKMNANASLLESRFVLKVAEQITTFIAGQQKPDLAGVRTAMVNIFGSARASCETLAKSAGHELFKTAFASVMRQPEVICDITAIEFLVPRNVPACKSCEAHNAKVMAPTCFGLAICNECDTVYRIHFADDE